VVELARRKGIRGKFTRNRSIALFVAVFAFALVGLGVIDIGVDILGGGGFIEGTNFSVEVLGNIIPLALVPNLGVNCSLWTEGDIVATDGTRRPIGFDTTVFNPLFSLDVFDPSTNKELREVDADIKLRCDSPLLDQDEFVLTGGTISHSWSVENRATGQYTVIGSVFTKSVSPSNIILQSPTGSGVRISGGTIQAAAIDSQSISSEPQYLVELTLNVVGNFVFEQRQTGAGGVITLTKTVALVSQIGSNAGEFLRVQNEFIDPEPASSNIVDITETVTIPQPIFKSDLSPQVRICVDAPLYDSSKETRPRIDVFRPVADGSASLTKFISAAGTFGSSGGQRFCTTIDLSTSQMFVGNYRVEASMASRTGTDTSIFTVYEDSQDPMTPIPISPCEGLSGAALIQCAEEQAEITPDPCEGLTGPTLDQCLGIAQQFGGCSTGFTEVSNDSFVDIASILSGASRSVIIQSGSSTSDDPICLAQESIALAGQLASGGGAPSTDICEGLTQEQCEVKLIGEQPTTTTTTGITCSGGNVAVGNACVQSCAGLTDAQCSTVIASCATSTSNTVPECNAILKATQSTGAETIILDVSQEAKGLILYQIVYDGDDEVGSISNLQTSPVRFDPLEFAGVPSGKEFYEFARLIINPVIDITNIDELIQTSNSNPQFTYTWTAEVTKSGQTPDVREIEKCNNNCGILDTKTLGFKVGGDQIQSIESEFRDKTFYHIAQTDIQPNELMAGIERAFGLSQIGLTPAESLDRFLDSGDKIKITLDVEGSFEPTITDPTTLTTEKVRASISPMQWSHTFTWIPDFGADREPCAKLSGQAQLNCEGNPIATSLACEGLTANQCNNELPALDPEGCINKVVGLNKIRLCYGVGEEEEEVQSTSSFGSKSDASDTEGKGSIVNFCPSGSTVTECGKIALKILEERITGFLGITSSDIQNLSDNALLYVGIVIGVLIFFIILRALFIRWRLRHRFRTGF